MIGSRQTIANARIWADRLGFGHEDYPRMPAVLEAWSDAEIAHALDRMTVIEPRISVDMVDGVNNAQTAPRLDGLPLVMIRFGERIGMIDGKHRAHKWKRVPGDYAVLVIESAHR